jgi:uncharacterized protein (UPF0548 family)
MLFLHWRLLNFLLLTFHLSLRAVSIMAIPSRYRIVLRRSMLRMKSKEKCQVRNFEGTHLSFQKPSPQMCSTWFTSDVATFNHNSVGMTNPYLHISVVQQSTIKHVSPTSSTIRKSKASNSEQISQETSIESNISGDSTTDWWPATFINKEKSPPRGWKRLKYHRRVGYGRACYDAVRDRALAWEWETPEQGILIPRTSVEEVDYYHPKHHHHPIRRQSTNAALCVGTCRLVTYSRCALPRFGFRKPNMTSTSRPVFGLWCSNPIQVVYNLVDQRGPRTTYSSTAYATTAGHWLCGEERVTVAMRDFDEEVSVELLSISKPATLWTKLAWPLVHRMQEKFFQGQLNWLQSVATESTPNASKYPTIMSIQTKAISAAHTDSFCDSKR